MLRMSCLARSTANLWKPSNVRYFSSETIEKKRMWEAAQHFLKINRNISALNFHWVHFPRQYSYFNFKYVSFWVWKAEDHYNTKYSFCRMSRHRYVKLCIVCGILLCFDYWRTFKFFSRRLFHIFLIRSGFLWRFGFKHSLFLTERSPSRDSEQHIPFEIPKSTHELNAQEKCTSCTLTLHCWAQTFP